MIAQVLITGLFALSFDLLVGYAGIPSLGHAAFFGIGAYTAGLLATRRLGRADQRTLVVAAIVAGAFRLARSASSCRGLTGIAALIMITLGVGSAALRSRAQRARHG